MSATLNKTAVSQVSDAALIDEMNARLKAGIIDADALAISSADDDDEATGAVPDDEIDSYSLEEALARFRRRDYPDTLFYLERALGRDWVGLHELVLGRP